jgi:hypothetical protein
MLNYNSEQRIKKLEDEIISLKLQVNEDQDRYHTMLNARNMVEYYTTAIFNDAENIDADHPFYMDFRIPSTINEIVKAEVSFVMGNYRASLVDEISEGGSGASVSFSISEDSGASYKGAFGPYGGSRDDMDITDYLNSYGNKRIKFTADYPCRLTVTVVCKLKVGTR